MADIDYLFLFFHPLEQWGMDWACCDSCCRCTCCWDEGEFDPNGRPGAAAAAAQQSQQDSVPTNRPEEEGDGLPSYKASEQMSVPAATTITPAA